MFYYLRQACDYGILSVSRWNISSPVVLSGSSTSQAESMTLVDGQINGENALKSSRMQNRHLEVRIP